MFILLNAAEFPTTFLLNQVEGRIKKLFHADEYRVLGEAQENIVFLHCNGGRDNEASCNIHISNLMSHVRGMYRRLLLHNNEQETVLSFSQQLVIIQIVLHRLHMDQKSVAEVKNIRNKITRRKLKSTFQVQHQENPCNVSFSEDIEMLLLREPKELSAFEKIFEGYEKFLAHSNVVDFVDVLQSLGSELPLNSELQEMMAPKKSIIVFINSESISCAEMKVVGYMLQHCDLFEATISTSLDDSIHEDLVPEVTIDIMPSTELELLGKFKVQPAEPSDSRFASPNWRPSSQRGSSLTLAEVYAEQLILSYLSLLVNSRNELALATVINVPDRGICHKSFTDIKHQAASKNLSMYQTIISFVLKSRLGGKGYAPDKDDPLVPLLKGLAEFADLYNKMHSVVEEEDADSRNAVVRLVKIIKNTLSKASAASLSSPPSKSLSSLFQQPIKRGALESAAASIMASFEVQLKLMESLDLDGITPTRLIKEGSSANGRRTLRLIRDVVDLHASYDDPESEAMTSDTVLTQTGTTPLRMLPSLVSKFRSPEEILVANFGSILTQNTDQNGVMGLKRHMSTPNRVVQEFRKKPRPLFSRSFSSPSENKENIPPVGDGGESRPPQKLRTKLADKDLKKQKMVKKAQRPTKRGLFKNGNIGDKTQLTLRQFFC